MTPIRTLLAALIVAAGTQGAFADQGDDEAAADSLIGTWKLVSLEAENPATKERRTIDRNQHGYLVVTPDRLTSMVASGGGGGQFSGPGFSGPRPLLAYTGAYKIEGDRIITRVDLAWTDDWVGRDQTRVFRIEGDKLYLEFVSQGQKPQNAPRSMLVWERSR
jgi:hypothetical protein